MAWRRNGRLAQTLPTSQALTGPQSVSGFPRPIESFTIPLGQMTTALLVTIWQAL